MLKMLPERSKSLLKKKKNGRVVKFNWFFLKPHKIEEALSKILFF